MPELSGFSACVSVEGVDSQEYSVEPSADGKQLICWICSEAGKTFTVSWEALSIHPFAYSAYLYVNGTYCTSRVIQASRPKRKITLAGADTSPTTSRPLTFSKVNLTDDDAYLHVATGDFGDIKLDFNEVVPTAISADANDGMIMKPGQLQDRIHERSKKGLTHCIRLGEETQQPRFKVTPSRTVRHIGTFVFKYRPLDVLQANGIVPIDRKRKEPVTANDVLDLTADDLKEEDAQQKIKDLEAQLAALKRRHNPNKRIKTEVKAEQQNIIPLGEVIDLT